MERTERELNRQPRRLASRSVDPALSGECSDWSEKLSLCFGSRGRLFHWATPPWDGGGRNRTSTLTPRAPVKLSLRFSLRSLRTTDPRSNPPPSKTPFRTAAAEGSQREGDGGGRGSGRGKGRGRAKAAGRG